MAAAGNRLRGWSSHPGLIGTRRILEKKAFNEHDVLSFRLYHESEGVGVPLQDGRTTDLYIPFERDTARMFLWSRPGVIGADRVRSVQNQMDD